jgi:hypothetical protein
MSDSAAPGLKIPSTATSGTGAAMDGACAAIPTRGFHPHDNRNKASRDLRSRVRAARGLMGAPINSHAKGNGMKTKTWWLVGAAAVWCVAVTAALAEGTRSRAEGEAACVQEAKKLKGEERDKALAACEKGGAGRHAQQEKMKTCNVEAGRKQLHGDERRAFMSSCLKG